MDAVMRAGRLVAWGNAVLAGLVSPDTAADRVKAGDARHLVVGVPAPLAGPTLPMLLASLGSGGVGGLLLILPAPGDPLGLPGPAGFNATALDAGEAVLTMGQVSYGIVPAVQAIDPDGPPGVVVHWNAEPVNRRVGLELPSLSEAERDLGATLTEVTRALADLDLARWRPQLTEALRAIRDGVGTEGLAPGYPGRAHRVLATAQRCAAIAALARTDPGGATGAGAAAVRDASLKPLADAARRATVAAFNCVVEPKIAGATTP